MMRPRPAEEAREGERERTQGCTVIDKSSVSRHQSKMQYRRYSTVHSLYRYTHTLAFIPLPSLGGTTEPYFEKTVAGSTVERRDEWEAGKRATVAYLAHTRLRRGRETPCELADSRKTRLDFRVGTRDDEGVVSTQRAKK
jgi:hypothetical protein